MPTNTAVFPIGFRIVKRAVEKDRRNGSGIRREGSGIRDP